MAFYREGRSERDFDAGIGKAVSAVLINPEFLFRVEVDPDKTPPGDAYRISDLELASRLSFFLWSSLPDDALLDSAIRGELRRPGVLERHVRRMLADPRSYNLASNFAGQWLRVRNLTSVDPNVRLYPDFDDNLRQAFRLETELFVDSVVREDRSVLDLMRADYTFLNERLAKHYGIPNVYGSRFRRVELGRDSRRGGLLRQGSILAVTSYATRTSPVLRGVWVLSNIVGAPPPPPLPNVPALDGNVPANLPVRERMAAHRANPGVRELSSDDRSRGIRAGEFRRGWSLARTGRRQRTHRRVGSPARRRARSTVWLVSKRHCSGVRSSSPPR